MFISWLHKSWKYFWTVVLCIIVFLMITVGGAIGLMQMKSTKNYLANWIEDDFAKTYNANLSIGELNGLIPFTLKLNMVSITAPGTADFPKVDTLARLDTVEADIDVLSLFKNKVNITGFSVTNPQINLLATQEGTYSLFRILRNGVAAEKKPSPDKSTWLSNVEVVAPKVVVRGGGIFVDKLLGDSRKLDLPEPLRITDINTEMFLEVTSSQRFWDIESLSATVEQVDAGAISIVGQIYNDDTVLEFNGFTFKAGNSELSLNGKINGVNLFKKGVSQQIQDATFDVDAGSSRLVLGEFLDIYPDLPTVSEPLNFNIAMAGSLDSLQLNNFTLGVGSSYFQINGLFKNLSRVKELSYRLQIADVSLHKKDLEIFTDSLKQKEFIVLENLAFNGSAEGSLDSVNVDINTQSPYGNLAVKGKTQLKKPYAYSGSLNGEGVNVAPFFTSRIDTSSLNFEASVTGVGIAFSEAFLDLSATIYNSSVNTIPVDRLELKSTLVGGFWEQDYTYQSGPQKIEGTGWIDFSMQEPALAIKGNAEAVDLAAYKLSANLPSSQLNFDYNIELQGLQPDRMQGKASLDIKPSIINNDTVRSHQFYMDLDSPNQENRAFRLTSSMFDITVTGNIVPTNIGALARHWRDYLSARFKQELLLDSVRVPKPNDADISAISLNGNFKAKDINLLQHYWSKAPDLETDLRLNFNVNADSSRFLFSTELRTDSLRYNTWQAKNATAQLTASFQSNKKFKEFSNVDFESKIERLNTDIFDLDSVSVDAAYKQDSLRVRQKIGSISGNASMDLVLNTVLSDSSITVAVDSFFLGNDRYAWQNERIPRLKYNRDEEFIFNGFSFKNRSEFFEIKGTLSPNKNDSLEYILRDINLQRISELISGRVNFGGKLNGTFQTRSLAERPSIQGELNVNKFTLDNRVIGDAKFLSRYNAAKNRFDTRIRVLTDSTKYSEYLASNDDIGQNILIDGYFIPPDTNTPQDTVYSFDIDFNQIDMWVIPLISHKVFSSMEGQASGQGYLTGNLNEYDFHADFQTQNVFTKPEFVNTNYFLNGHVVLDKEEGVVLDSVKVTDTKGGSGLLWGSIDLNDFNPITFIDLNFRLNKLQFLNNAYDPDVPFYGNVSGTGLLKLTGSNTDLFLRTAEPISVTQESKVSIPLIEETELNQNSKFIQFVDAFDVSKKERVSLAEEQVRNTKLDRNVLEQAIDQLTFTERVDLDLQFNAPENINVDLIFDPVTGDVLTAQGTGQLRITMQNEDVQMFGNYNVTGGTYQFVSGEIISRKLALERGGMISWEGDPENARLNINAIYNARPNIANLNPRNNVDNNSESAQIQRVPIDLVIEIKGTVVSVENDYYFRLSNNFELSSNSTLSFAINEINRDEQQKFLQATSILLSGEFIPSESYNQATTSLSQNLTRGSTVINPLLSNQVISPLLSNQINSLLNSDVSRFDIDFNLNAYNEIDLGIALRLYNDKLVFRREGQITGTTESTVGDRIGDLNATYKINKRLSLTAFHRQDQTLGTVSRSSQTGDVTPSIDGVGFEAEVQFNTWKGLSQRLRKTFNKIFGIKNNKENEEKLASDKSEKNN